jgi:starch synthase
MKVVGKDIRVYFITHKQFFDRVYLYGESSGDYPDNMERFSFFCHSAMELLKELGEPVDIIHCHDWQTGLVPVLLKENYKNEPVFARTRAVFTIHNLAYQGIFPREDYAKLGVSEDLFNDRQIEFYEKINLLKSGIVFSDYVTTVSPQYAKEIQTKDFGCGLEGVLRKKERLTGILNGLDYEQWNPETDEFLEMKYNAKDWIAKKYHKEQMRSAFGLPSLNDMPVFGFVGRLCYQKGFDLIESAFEDLMARPIQMAFLGVGEEKYQKILKKLSKKYHRQCAVWIDYHEVMARQVYAGSDFFLMPSVYEPCGLTQMIALRYGTIPVTSHVGGLADTVIDVSAHKEQGNGVNISSYSVAGLLEAVDRAIGIYGQKEKMNALILHAMACRWTWDSSAERYMECYHECLKSE